MNYNGISGVIQRRMGADCDNDNRSQFQKECAHWTIYIDT